MSEDIGRLIKFYIKLKPNDSSVNESATENCFALGKLYSDGFFYGFMCAGIDEEEFEAGDFDITHLITGVYDKELGLDLLRFPQNPNVTPILFRTLAEKDSEVCAGKFYSIQKTRFILFGGQANGGEFVNYVDVGDSVIAVDESDMDFYNYSTIRSIDSRVNEFFINPDYAKYYENSFKEQSIKELHEDIEKCYEETHGEQYGQ